MRRFLKPGRYANVTATLALVVALGGTSYAAVTLAPNSVGNAQLRANAVTSSKVKDRSLLAKDFKRGQLPQGPRGATGPAGPQGATGAFPDTLPSGKTLRGTFATEANAAGSTIRTGISFPVALASPPTPHYVIAANPVPAECRGGTVAAPQAAPGNLCVFEEFTVGASANRGVIDPSTDSENSLAVTFGAGVYAVCTTSPCLVEGTWAVTAP